MDMIGFIGLGSMGGTLLESLLRYGAFSQDKVLVSTRTKGKNKGFISLFPDIQFTNSNIELAEKCRTIFICVKTGDVKDILMEIKPCLMTDAHLVFISAGLTIKNIEKIFSGKLTKVVPSLTCRTKNSVSLVFHNQSVTTKEASKVETWLSSFGMAKKIGEDQFEVGADLTSCSPAFFASMIRHFALAGSRYGGFEEKEAEEMAMITILGTARMLREHGCGFDELISGVATKGGIAEEGLKIIDKYLPPLFDKIFEATLNKHSLVKRDMDKQYTA